MKGLKRKFEEEKCPISSINNDTNINNSAEEGADHQEEGVEVVDNHHHRHNHRHQSSEEVGGDGEVEEEEDDDEENEGDGGEGEEYDEQHSQQGKDVADDADKPKLAEGFYEIEAVRRKRIRKGKLQYLIKWRGWPETANTWEPLENLQSCSDIIYAFEEGLKSGKYRKRKRKYGAGPTLPKKKQQQHHHHSSMPSKQRTDEHEPMHFAPTNHPSVTDDDTNIPHQHDELDLHAITNGPTNLSSDIQVRKENNGGLDLDMKINDLKNTVSKNENNTNKAATDFNENKASTGDENTRRIGAKRRKSGSVKRFKQESFLSNLNENQNEMTRVTVGSSGRVESPRAENKCLKNAFAITEIMKPISYSTSVTNEFHDVLVTFTARRSDGKEVMVDNNYLKANNPLLLIDFYEQHLRYSPTS